jgi:hypothetical protein
MVRAAATIFIGLVTVILTVGAASAGFDGHTINLNYEYPNLGTVLVAGGNQVVGAGVEYPVIGNGYVDLSDTGIVFNYTGPTFPSAAPFNGYHFFDVFASIDPIVGVTLVSTTFTGFDQSRISFDSDNIYVNIGGLVATDPQIVLSVEFGQSSVPLPPALVLLALGAGILGVTRRLTR